MTRNTQATFVTLALMLAVALISDVGADVPVGSLLFFLLFGPISLLLWRKENIRDYTARDLLKFCWSGVALAIAIGIQTTLWFWLQDPPSLREQITESTGWVLLLVFLVVSGIFVVFVLLSFLRLAIKYALTLLLGTSDEG
jgi:hypothetical protein